MGLSPVFVFDGASRSLCTFSGVCEHQAGPSPQIKFATTIDRLNDGRVKPSLIFFRTSAAGRASARFLSDPALRMLPPLVHAACIRALLHADVECHFADSEGDPFAVELAGTLGAYVVRAITPRIESTLLTTA